MNKPVEVLLQEDAYLEKWSEWSPCTISCISKDSKDFGTRTRKAKCIDGINGGQTCFDLLGDTSLQKVETVNCAEEINYCPIDHEYLPWTSWSECPKCREQSQRNVERKRTRNCVDGKYGGSECPLNIR